MSEYLTMGADAPVATSGPVPKFNSTKYPGTCKPSDFGTLSLFKALQEQLNRVAQVNGIAKIAVDGDVGPGTLGLMAKLGLAASGTPCTSVAAYVVTFTATTKALADTLQAPAKVSGPAPIKAPTIVTAGNLEIPAPPGAGIIGSIQNMGTPAIIAAVGIAGGIGYMLFFKKKRRK